MTEIDEIGTPDLNVSPIILAQSKQTHWWIKPTRPKVNMIFHIPCDPIHIIGYSTDTAKF